MRIPFRRALMPLVGLAGLVGSLIAAHALRAAIGRCQDLYRVDTVGSQLEGQLEYLTQESRRTFLYALAVTDPNDQLPYIDQARNASQKVLDVIGNVRALGAPAISQKISRFEDSWKKYGEARDEILARILEGETATAIQTERRRGQPAFEQALQDLHALSSALAQHAREASLEVNTILKLCVASLWAFVLSMSLIVGLLVKANHGRSRALHSLRNAHQTLAAAKELEQHRAAILELVSKHAPLSHILARTTKLFAQTGAEVSVAAWAVSENDFRLQGAANLPHDLEAGLGRLPRTEESAAGVGELARRCNTEAQQFGLLARDPLPLYDAAGQLIGALEAFVRKDCAVSASPALLDSIANLASIAMENALLYERLAFQAQHDILTGLPNRLLFHDRVQQATLLAARHNKMAAVIMLDLDRYKQINDTLGHRAGDELLCEVGRRLKACLRQCDTVGRIGGDEFSILVDDLLDASDVGVVVAKILNAISRPMPLHHHEVAITATAGISLFPEHGSEAGDLLRNADLAMYAAKRGGGNTFCIFRTDLGDSVRRRLEIERELKKGLEQNEFSIEFQPQLSRDGELAGLEALLRWNSAKLGRIGPADFIPIAEEMGLIPALGEWVLASVCRTGAGWLESGLDVPRIAINVSTIELNQKGFAASVESALRKHGFPGSKLELEITETALMSNVDQVIEHIDSLRGLGVRFAIDDFGTGYSSLNQLRALPVDRIKVDRSFIKDLGTGKQGSETLVRGIIALAQNLRLETVAEGVETEQQLTLLNSIGCEIYQGFLFHRPMPTDAVQQLLAVSHLHQAVVPRDGAPDPVLSPA